MQTFTLFFLLKIKFPSMCSGFVHQVMDNAVPNMSSAGGQQQVWRAQFSSLAPVDLKRAMANLGSPNKDMSDSVDARADTWIWMYSGLNMCFFESNLFVSMLFQHWQTCQNIIKVIQLYRNSASHC